MKNIIVVLFGVLFAITSCTDAIDIDQPGRLSEEFAFRNVANLEQGVLGLYNRFDYTSAIQFNALFTDDLSIGVDNGGQGLGDGTYAFRLNPQSAIASTWWTRYYGALNAASRIIEAAALVDIGEGEQAAFDNALGQAYALRAWAHFELLSYYTTDMTDDNALSVILLDFVPSQDQTLPRNTNGEIFQSIFNDLDQAEDLITTQSNPIFVSLDFVTALKARIAAYRGRYAEADALAASLLASYPLADRTQYFDMYQDTDNTEVIFKLQRTIGDSYDGQGSTGSAFAGGWAGANFAFVNATIDGSPYFEMSNSLFNLLNPFDVRYDVNLHPTSDLGNNILVVGKYRGKDGQPLMNDLKVFRAAEMLLIRAEAAADANNLAAAAGFVEQLRDARFDDDQDAPVYTTQAQAFLGILQERRIEFAYEGFRWMDLRRLGQRAGISGIQRDPTDCAINGACDLPITDFRWTLPLPLVEFNGNPVIAQQQNPGY